ncbi:hypothetical protein Tco_1381382, partial [Tanacetum coccineum]
MGWMREFKRFTRNTIFPSNAAAILEHDGVAEVSDDDTPEDTNAVDRTSMKRLVRGPQMHTPSKTSEHKKKR